MSNNCILSLDDYSGEDDDGCKVDCINLLFRFLIGKVMLHTKCNASAYFSEYCLYWDLFDYN